MINFFVAEKNPMYQGTADTAEKAAEILKLIFTDKKAFVVEQNSVRFAQNMMLEEAENLNPALAFLNDRNWNLNQIADLIKIQFGLGDPLAVAKTNGAEFYGDLIKKAENSGYTHGH